MTENTAFAEAKLMQVNQIEALGIKHYRRE